MLFALKLKVFILFLGIATVGSAQAYSNTIQNDAATIVKNALEAASETKNCSSAAALVHLGEEGVRQTLRANTTSKNDAGVIDTRVDDTRVDDTFPYPKLLVFVSFSMPEESLKALNAQVSRVGGKLVLRGLVGGSFRETAQKLKKLQIDIIIDPPLFEAYKIDRSPIFILRSTLTEKAEEDVTYDLMTGNVSLDYVLEQFASRGETRIQALEMLKTLRETL